MNKTKEAFQHLKEMKIKFPGKSDDEAELLLSTVRITFVNSSHREQEKL